MKSSSPHYYKSSRNLVTVRGKERKKKIRRCRSFINDCRCCLPACSLHLLHSRSEDNILTTEMTPSNISVRSLLNSTSFILDIDKAGFYEIYHILSCNNYSYKKLLGQLGVTVCTQTA